MAKKLAPCKFCCATPRLEPYHSSIRDKQNGAVIETEYVYVKCRCGAYGQLKTSPEAAAKSWGGDEKGNGYHQSKMD